MAKDGGPAFGHAAENGHCCGMSFLDYSAAAALTGYCANPEALAAIAAMEGVETDEDMHTAIGALCYEHAAGLLRAREETSDG